MIIQSQSLLTDFLQPKSERTGNYFGHIMGIDNAQAYKDLLARFNKMTTDSLHQVVLFKNAIPKPNDVALINNILAELSHMRIGNFKNEQIELTNYQDLNQKICEALDTIIPLAIANERFASQTIQNNFIAKLLIWINVYAQDIDFSKSEVPKCIYYGPIKRHECYLLMVLALVGFDTFYLNPTHDATFGQVDTAPLSQILTLGKAAPLEDFDLLASQGVVIDRIITSARQASDEIETVLYTDTGVFRPWQFAKGTTHPILLDAILEDIQIYWNEPARMRPGFKTSGQVVYPPVFFTKISGVHINLDEYYEFVHKLCDTKRYCFYNQPNFVNTNKLSSRDMYSLTYCLNPDKTINRETIKTHTLYKNMLTFRAEVQDFILNKLDEILSPNFQTFFNFNVTDKERSLLMALTFTLETKLLNLIDSFDFPSDIPKLILYINNRQTFTTEVSMLLALLNTIGFDIVLLCPNAANNIELMLSEKYINTLRLPELAYDLQLKNPQKNKSFFNKLFR